MKTQNKLFKILVLICLIIFTLPGAFAQNKTTENDVVAEAVRPPDSQPVENPVTNPEETPTTNNLMDKTTPVKPVENAVINPTSQVPLGKLVENAITNPEVQTPVKDVVNYDLSPDVKMFGRALFDTGNEIFMPNPDAPVPDSYELGTGDKLEIICWFGNVEYERSVQSVTPIGDIYLKTLGNIAVTRKTISDIRRDLRVKYSKLYTNFDLTVNLVGQRSIPVYVMGEVKKPGKFLLPSLATVFTALFGAGGPTEIGSLRNIKLMRGAKQIAQIDIYDYLLDGKYVDQPLQSGDTIYIPMNGKIVTVYGAVNRAAKYELLKENTVDDVLAICGGVTSNASNNVRIMRMDSIAGRTVKEIIKDAPGKLEKVQNGDEIYIRPVLGILQNAVTVIGAVNRPGPFPADQAVTVSKLIMLAGGLIDNEAYIEQAVITRLRSDSSTYQIPFNLRSVMDGKPDADVKLQPKDTLKIIYRKDILQSLDVVTIQGGITKPGAYPYLQGMKISDLINLGFGTTTDAYLKQAHLYRFPVTITSTGSQSPGGLEVIQVDLVDILSGNKKNDLELRPRDLLKIYNRKDIAELQDVVLIDGEVVKPGTYPYFNGMRVSDLLKVCFGTTTNAYLDQAFVYRYPSAGTIESKKETIIINITNIMNGDKNANIEMKQRDILKIFNRNELTELNDIVSISGEVVKAGSFSYKAGMHVSDLLKLSFGTTVNAYLDQAHLYRYPTANVATKLGENQQDVIILNINKVLNYDKTADIELKPRDIIKIYKRDEVTELIGSVTISGEVIKPGTYPYVTGMKISDLMSKAFGVTTKAYLKSAQLYRYPNSNESVLISFNLDSALSMDEKENYLLQPRDRIEIKASATVVDSFVTVSGEVYKPMSLPYYKGMKVSDAIFMTGGLKSTVTLDKALIVRLDEKTMKEYMIEVSLRDALSKKEADIELIRRDKLFIYPKENLGYQQSVAVAGAVSSPGIFPFVNGMKVNQLIFMAKGLLTNSYPEIAYLSRIREDKTSENIPLNLIDAQANVKNADINLNPGDKLTVMTREEMMDKKTVVVRGYVRKSGELPLTVGMKLSDALALSGGLKLDAEPKVMLFRTIDGETKSMEYPVKINENSFSLSVDPLLENKDLITVRGNADYVAMTETIDISGNILHPGTYPAYNGNRLKPKTLYQLINEAGGIMKNGYSAGLILYRPNASVQTVEQRREMERVLKDLDAGSGAVSSSKMPTLTAAVTAKDVGAQNINVLSSQMARAISSEKNGKIVILTPPRSMQDQQVAYSIPVEADKIINSNGKTGDIKLLPGDAIYVPDIPTTVTVLGGVFSNGSVVYDKTKDLKSYINAVGGYSKDAEPSHLILLRMNGMVIPAKKTSKILPGDIIIVPTTFIIKNIRNENLFETSLNVLSELALTYLPFKK